MSVATTSVSSNRRGEMLSGKKRPPPLPPTDPHPFALFSCLLKTQPVFPKKSKDRSLTLSRLRSTKIRPTRRRHQLMSDPSKQRLLKEDTGQSDAERARSPDKEKAQRRCQFNWPRFPPEKSFPPQNKAFRNFHPLVRILGDPRVGFKFHGYLSSPFIFSCTQQWQRCALRMATELNPATWADSAGRVKVGQNDTGP